ncbi:hypothetical protein NEPAR04_1478 [Nematocida parisii]|nr:hypothetical protein NEPAR08_1662 [Nematocida parisii]KAI5129635.1 hypothetical protein NEPAR03_1765 [Nematocida parisii]KAI5142232.1 hypothetical protein NEPAR04_1478 [Nematocida parisii]
MNTQKEKAEETKQKEESYNKNLPSTSRQDISYNENLPSTSGQDISYNENLPSTSGQDVGNVVNQLHHMANLLTQMIKSNKNKEHTITSIISNFIIENDHANSELNRMLLTKLLKHYENKTNLLSFDNMSLKVINTIRVIANKKERMMYNEYVGVELIKLLYNIEETRSQMDLNTIEEHVTSHDEHNALLMHTEPSRTEEHVTSHDEHNALLMHTEPSRTEEHVTSHEEHNTLLSSEYETDRYFFESDIGTELEDPVKLELSMPLNHIDSNKKYQSQSNNYESVLTKDEICTEIEVLRMLLNNSGHSLDSDMVKFGKMLNSIIKLKLSHSTAVSKPNYIKTATDNFISDVLNHIEDKIISNYKNEKGKGTQLAFSLETISTLEYLKNLFILMNIKCNPLITDEVDTEKSDNSLASTSNEIQQHTLLPKEILNADLPEESVLGNSSTSEQVLSTNIMEMILMRLNALWYNDVNWGVIIKTSFMSILAIIMILEGLKLFLNIIRSSFAAGIFQIR